MFLKRAVLVNWGNIPQLEFDFGPINLFSGGNGSGKTTAADAIQTLMTAAHENLFNYNPGQDETTQRGRGGKQVRTLASYVLGCDDGSYARPWTTDSYVAGVFHPTPGESGEVFTAVLCMRAHLDRAGPQAQARLGELFFIIVPAEQLTLPDFVKTRDDGRHVLPITELATELKKSFGSNAVEVYDKKGVYLRRLYGALRGRTDAVSDREAKHAARTFANFMAYKPVKSINEFVAREILEPKDLGDAIRNVSELMKTIHQMEQDTRAIRNAIGTLQQAKQYAADYVTLWTDRALAEYREASRRAQQNQKAYLAAKRAQQNEREAVAANEESLRLAVDRRRQKHETIVALEARRQGIPALKTKDELEQRLEECNRQLVAKTAPLMQQDKLLGSNAQALQHLLEHMNSQSPGLDAPALEDKTFRQLAKEAISISASTGIDLSQLLGQDWIDIAPLESYLDQIRLAEAAHRRAVEYLYNTESGPSVREQLASATASAERRRQDLNLRLKQKQREIQLLENRKVSYPGYVETALAAIRQACPAADPQVLCDYIEVLDPRWQMAIEGYIGGARFSIIVEADYEAEAIRIVRALPDARRNKARVIQGAKAQRDAERLSLAKDSITEVMSFSHKTAEFYLKASYGSVAMVADAETLRTTARGLTAEGMASGNYSMWRCDMDDSELVFGQAARERALRAKLAEGEALIEEANRLEQYLESGNAALRWVDAIKPVACLEIVEAMLALHRQWASTQSALRQLDLSDFQQLEDELQALKQQHNELDDQIRELNEDAGRLKERSRTGERHVQELARAQDIFTERLGELEQAAHRISAHRPHFDVEAALTQMEAEAADASGGELEEQLKQLGEQLENAERALYQAVLQHNQQCATGDSIAYDTGPSERHSEAFFGRLNRLGAEVDLLHNRLKNNVLVDKFDKLSALKDSFNTAFVTNLCHSIYQAITDGKRILDDLNKELEHHRFGADRERFYFAYDWVPEYREYWRFFKEVIELPNLGDGASLFEAELSAKACAVRDKVMVMLLDPDEQIALRELGRLSDYRNYRHYEIYKEPEGKAPIPLSQYGTGSGGQLETPAYIIRAAAVTSAFRFDEGNTHLRMVLVDEAFSKMDETRSREVIAYLTESLGLQLLFIMPTSKSGPFMDLISNQFVFSKCPTARAIGELNTRVLVDRKVCNQAKIQALWANHRQQVRHQGLLDFMEDLAGAQ